MHTSNFLTRLLADPARADPHRRHRPGVDRARRDPLLRRLSTL